MFFFFFFVMYLAHFSVTVCNNEFRKVCLLVRRARLQCAAVTKVPRSKGPQAAEVSVTPARTMHLSVCSSQSCRAPGRWAFFILNIASCYARMKRGLQGVLHRHLSAWTGSSHAGLPTHPQRGTQQRGATFQICCRLPIRGATGQAWF